MEQQLEQDKKKKKEKSLNGKEQTLDAGIISINSKTIVDEMNWMQKIIDHHLRLLEKETEEEFYFTKNPPPEFNSENSAYAELVNRFTLSSAERLLLICSLMPHFSQNVRK